MSEIKVKTKVISLKPYLDSDTAEEMVDSRKVKLFQTLLHKPKKSEIHLHSLNLHFEAILLLTGKYSVDFIRDATHTLSVDKNVQEILIDDKVFPVKKKKGVLSKLEPSFKNKVKIENFHIMNLKLFASLFYILLLSHYSQAETLSDYQTQIQGKKFFSPNEIIALKKKKPHTHLYGL